MTRGEGSFKGTMPIMETYLVSSPWQKARRRHHVAIMDLSDSSQNNNASVDCNISIEESSTFHLQLAIITKHHDPVIQVPITSNHVDNRFCCITMNRHDKGLSCTSTHCVSIGGFSNHQVNSKNMKGAKTETVENILNLLAMNKLGPIQAKYTRFNIEMKQLK